MMIGIQRLRELRATEEETLRTAIDDLERILNEALHAGQEELTDTQTVTFRRCQTIRQVHQGRITLLSELIEEAAEGSR